MVPNKIITSCFPGKEKKKNPHPNGILVELFSVAFKANLLTASDPELVEINPLFFFFFFFRRKRSVLEWKVKALNPASGLQRSTSETNIFM